MKERKSHTEDLHVREDRAREVIVDFVSTSANGFGFFLMAIRTSQTRITPSGDAEATKYGSSSETANAFLVSTTIPLRAECASSCFCYLVFWDVCVFMKISPLYI